MKQERKKIAIVGRKLSFEEAEEEDLLFWAGKTAAERLEETEKLRRMIWTHRLGYYPEKMELVGRVIKKGEEEDL